MDANRVPYAYHFAVLTLGRVEWLGTLPPTVIGFVAVLLMLPALLVAALPFLVIGLALFHLVTRPVAALLQSPVIAYGLTGFALWFSEFHRRDIMHLIYGCPLLLIALSYLGHSG